MRHLRLFTVHDGANGVILVTTKSAKEGQIKVSYDGYVQVKNVSKTLETLSAQEYILHNWSYAASRGTANQDAVENTSVWEVSMVITMPTMPM